MPATKQPVNILLVDDAPDLTQMYSQLLEREGFQCFEAIDSTAALSVLQEEQISLILLDIILPGKSGIDLLKEIKKDYPDTAVIMVTGIDDRNTAIETLKLGAYSFLTKPINHNELYLNISNALIRQELESKRVSYNAELEKHIICSTKHLKKMHLELTDKISQNKASEARFNMIAGTSSDMIHLNDRQGRILYTNKATEHLLGYSAERMFNKRASDFIHPEDRELIQQDMQTLINGKKRITREIRLYKINGEYLEVEVNGFPIQQENGEVYLGAIIRDITDRKQMEQSLRQSLENSQSLAKELQNSHQEIEQAYQQLKTSQAQIVQQEKMASIGQLAAGVAHEINNPTGFISSNLNSLATYTKKLIEFIDAQNEALDRVQENGDDTLQKLRKKLKIDYIREDAEDLIQESQDGCQRIKTIVSDLKNFSRSDQKKKEHAEINTVLEKTLSIIWNELKYKVELKKEFGELPKTWCYPQQLTQVFMNLLVNGSHAIKEKGEITIKTWHEDDTILVSISDTGCGIAKENLDKLFQPFFTTKEVGKGTGLGLSISHDIIAKHNGDIAVESEVGHGTTFTVKIPVITEPTE